MFLIDDFSQTVLGTLHDFGTKSTKQLEKELLSFQRTKNGHFAMSL